MHGGIKIHPSRINLQAFCWQILTENFNLKNQLLSSPCSDQVLVCVASAPWQNNCCAYGVGTAVPFLKERPEGEEAAPRHFGPPEFPTVFPRRCFSGYYLSENRKSLFSECSVQGCVVWNEKWLPQNVRLEGRWLQNLCCIRLSSFWPGFCSGWQGFCEAFTCRQKMLRREVIVEHHHQFSPEASCLLRHRELAWQKITTLLWMLKYFFKSLLTVSCTFFFVIFCVSYKYIV